MVQLCCGLDFGTSNSALGIIAAAGPCLVGLEGTAPMLPSAVFFNDETRTVHYGRAALEAYREGYRGRLLRALKSVLGSSLMHDSTLVLGRRTSFAEILTGFIRHIKTTAEVQAQQEISAVVLGRPVHFVDGNPEADRAAAMMLQQIAHAAGFQQVEFQYEPIAAALAFESQMTRETLALIVDIGGGTADFSVVRLQPHKANAAERQRDVLACGGVHLGGADFDRAFSLACVMPLLGYQTPLRTKPELDVPARYYLELATWHRIHGLYSKETQQELRQVAYEAQFPERVALLQDVLERRAGHALAAAVEAVKIRLSSATQCAEDLPFAAAVGESSHARLHATRPMLAEALQDAITRMVAAARQTVHEAGVQEDAIGTLFLTGGSCQLPMVREAFVAAFPRAEVAEGDMFGSVGLGLARDAALRFG